jgi:hypothetical protein
VVNGSLTKRCSGARIEIHRERVVEVEMLKEAF